MASNFLSGKHFMFEESFVTTTLLSFMCRDRQESIPCFKMRWSGENTIIRNPLLHNYVKEMDPPLHPPPQHSLASQLILPSHRHSQRINWTPKTRSDLP